ncbi:MAG: hypothetical protein FP825_11835 [Hyphomonas sp.]|uniref:hypothetical protein n=1 Tax=Hyphomonas sp. TaxID=87 RepID=UPI00182A761F|nr:hypothetical protein [Hyphomonas sp.]MBA3069157.1 hypothetical protein [Hyphomonas sp.]MBU4062342.1 hypothetical protein [Alphaproteobacteria bacterium]MBU4162724.1 hypothetical protein [Alphaproteobacteria bacterium]
MVRLVFVHGVSTRRGPTYDAAVAARHRRFRRDSFPGRTVTFFDPYWGEFGVGQSEFATIPDSDRPDPDWLTALTLARGSQQLLTRAKQDPAGVIAALGVLCADLAIRENDPALEALGDAISNLFVHAPQMQMPLLLARCSNDLDLMEHLTGMALAAQGLRTADEAAAGYAEMLLSETLIQLARHLSAPVGVFTGDVLHYMRCGAARRGTRAAVYRSLVEAGRSAADGPLVLIGYSLGAVILYELLADETVVRQIEAETGRPFRVDLLLTVGAPLGLFREINMVPAAPAGMCGPNGLVRSWLNTYARYDLLGFRCRPVFPAAADFEIDLDAGIVNAHTSYFLHRGFYRRLRAHLPETVSAD